MTASRNVRGNASPQGGPLRGKRVRSGSFAHRERDALAGGVYFQDGYFHLLTDPHHFVGVLDETIGQLADVHQAILVHADVDERAEGGDVGDDARHFHARPQVVERVDAFAEAEDLEGRARVAARLGQFGHNVVQGGQATASLT